MSSYKGRTRFRQPRALTFAEADAINGYVCASAFGVICHHGAASRAGQGRARTPSRGVGNNAVSRGSALDEGSPCRGAGLRGTVLRGRPGCWPGARPRAISRASMRYLPTMVALSGGTTRTACKPQDLVPVLDQHLGEQYTCRVVRVTREGAFRAEISDRAGGWRQTLPLRQAFRPRKRRSASRGYGGTTNDGSGASTSCKQPQDRQHRRADRLWLQVIPARIQRGDAPGFPLRDPPRGFRAHAAPRPSRTVHRDCPYRQSIDFRVGALDCCHADEPRSKRPFTVGVRAFLMSINRPTPTASPTIFVLTDRRRG